MKTQHFHKVPEKKNQQADRQFTLLLLDQRNRFQTQTLILSSCSDPTS